MNPLTHSCLLEEVLLPSAFEDSLAATRRAARRRRVRRRAVRSGTVLCLLVVAGWFVFQRVEIIPPVTVASTPDTATVALAPAPTFVLITTTPATVSAVVRTAAAPAAVIVSSRDMTSVTPRASEDELFALAGPRPAALHRLSDGSARWMWLDEKRSF
jgi:hypothetical protein